MSRRYSQFPLSHESGNYSFTSVLSLGLLTAQFSVAFWHSHGSRTIVDSFPQFLSAWRTTSPSPSCSSVFCPFHQHCEVKVISETWDPGQECLLLTTSGFVMSLTTQAQWTLVSPRRAGWLLLSVVLIFTGSHPCHGSSRIQSKHEGFWGCLPADQLSTT